MFGLSFTKKQPTTPPVSETEPPVPIPSSTPRLSTTPKPSKIPLPVSSESQNKGAASPRVSQDTGRPTLQSSLDEFRFPEEDPRPYTPPGAQPKPVPADDKGPEESQKKDHKEPNQNKDKKNKKPQTPKVEKSREKQEEPARDLRASVTSNKSAAAAGFPGAASAIQTAAEAANPGALKMSLTGPPSLAADNATFLADLPTTFKGKGKEIAPSLLSKKTTDTKTSKKTTNTKASKGKGKEVAPSFLSRWTADTNADTIGTSFTTDTKDSKKSKGSKLFKKSKKSKEESSLKKVTGRIINQLRIWIVGIRLKRKLAKQTREAKKRAQKLTNQALNPNLGQVGQQMQAAAAEAVGGNPVLNVNPGQVGQQWKASAEAVGGAAWAGVAGVVSPPPPLRDVTCTGCRASYLAEVEEGQTQARGTCPECDAVRVVQEEGDDEPAGQERDAPADGGR